LTRFGGHPEAFAEVLPMARTRPPYSPEFRRQMVDLVRAGRNPDDLAREFEPSGHSIRAWVAQAGRNEGRREEMAPALTAAERDEYAPGIVRNVGFREQPNAACRSQIPVGTEREHVLPLASTTG